MSEDGSDDGSEEDKGPQYAKGVQGALHMAFDHFMAERATRKEREAAEQQLEQVKGRREGGKPVTLQPLVGDSCTNTARDTSPGGSKISYSTFIGDDRRRSVLAENRPFKVLKISSQIVVRSDPGKFGPILCQLIPGYFVKCFEERNIDGVQWINISNGWICSLDSFGYKCFTVEPEDSAAKGKWAAEANNSMRVTNAIASLLARSHSLVNARRVARSIFKHSEEPLKPLVGLPEVSIEDLLISLASAKSLRQTEIFEFIRVAAAATSDPVGALRHICSEVHNTMSQRPSLWVKKEMSVLETHSMRRNNDQFVMMVARGDLEGCAALIQQGQEIAAVHSELKYTALHAASDFGQKAMVELLLQTGISTNIRDSRKGQSALHYCAQSGRTEIARLLIAKGADRMLQNHKGMMPYQVADEHGHYECREVLKQPPPEIQFVAVGEFNSKMITLNWVPPIINHKVHSTVVEYIIEWHAVSNEDEKVYYRTKELTLTLNNLRPSSGHAFTVYSWSLAGRSPPTSKIVHFTLPCEPDAPPSIEVLKVTTNGLLLHWHHTLFDNGGKVDYYQIELVDEETCLRLYNYRTKENNNSNNNGHRDLDASAIEEEDGPESRADWADNASEYSQESMNELSGPFSKSVDSLVSGARGNIQPPESSAQVSAAHRLFKHRNANERQKQIIGLTPGRNYFSRIRCHNEFGYSKWAPWTGPVQPQAGVQVKDFDLVKREVLLNWFMPIVGLGRRVDYYELQVCKLKGAYYKKIHLEEKKDNFFAMEKAIESEDTILEYVTLANDLSSNEFRLEDLQPGGRYQCRVRSCIDGVWCSWADAAMLSDVIIIPATRPNPPLNVAPALADDLDGDDINEGLTVKEYAITHNTIVLNWINGNSNGSPILEYNIICAKVRDYRISDLRLATKEAEGSIPRIDPSATWEDVDSLDLNTLPWEDVTNAGDFLGPGAFRVNNLLPGSSYIFRIRQRNQVDWSDFSAASKVLTTSPTAPPGCPEVYTSSSQYAICRWNESGESNNGLTNLEYDVELATRSLVESDEIILEPGQGPEDYKQIILEREQFRMQHSTWFPAVVRAIPNIAEFEYGKSHASAISSGSDIGRGSHSEGGIRKLYVLLDSLGASTFYYIRVRVRTLAGWSSWSYCKEAFRTASQA